MDITLAAQLIGLAGYALYVGAPSFSRREDVLRGESAGCALLCLQWMIMGHLILVASNLLVVLAAAIALGAYSNKTKAALSFFLYPAAIGSALYFWQDNIIDYLALSSLLLTLSAKRAENLLAFRGYSALSAGILVFVGMLAGSFPAVVFNGLFAAIHLWRIKTKGMTIYKERSAQRPTSPYAVQTCVGTR